MLMFNGRFSPALNTCGVVRPTAGRWPEVCYATARLAENALGFGAEASVPKGYQSAAIAWIPPIVLTGKMKVVFKAGSGFAVTSQAITKQSAALVGAAALTVLGVESHVRSAALVGSSAVAVNGKSAASIMVDLNCGAIPTAQDVAQATMQMTVESGISLQEVLRLLLAVAAGDATGLDANPAFKSADGSKTRVAGTRSGGTRTITTRDGT